MKKQAVIIFSFILLVFTICLVIWLNLSWRPDISELPPDSGFYAYYGKAILAGQIPYRDLWDNKPPFGYYLNAVALLIFGQTPWAVWWSSVIWILGCTILLFIVTRSLFGKITAGITCVLFLTTLMNPEIFQGGNLMEVYSLAPQIGIVGITYLFFLRQRKIKFAILAGSLTACAFLIKQPTVMLGISSVLVMTISAFANRKYNQAFKIAGGFILGAAGPIAMVSIYFLLVGALGQFYDQVLRAGLFYIGGAGSNLRASFFYTLVNMLPGLLIGFLYVIALFTAGLFLIEKLYKFWLKPILRGQLSVFEWLLAIVLAAIPMMGKLIWPNAYFGKFWLISIFSIGMVCAIKFYRSVKTATINTVFSSKEWIVLVAVVALPLEAVSVSLGGRYFGHYFITMIPSMLVVIAYLIHRVVIEANEVLRSKRISVWYAACLVLAAGSMAWGVTSFIRDVPAATNQADIGGIFAGQVTMNQLEQYIVNSTAANDEVLVWHIHLGINFVSDRKAGSRFLFPLNLFIPASADNNKLAQFDSELESQPPELILVQKPSSISLPFVDQPLDLVCQVYCAPEFELALKIPQIRQAWLSLQEYFNNHYVLDRRIYDWTVYRKLP